MMTLLDCSEWCCSRLRFARLQTYLGLNSIIMSFSTHSPGSYQQSPDPSGTYLPQYVQSLADQHSYTGHEKVTSTSHGLRPLPTDHSITPQVASQAIQKLVSNELRDVGFDSAQPSALRNLELEVAACKPFSANIPD